jgi:hypothetical protein
MPLSARLRRQVFDRAHGCCEYCLSQADFVPETFAIDHIIPVSQGGSDEPENLALACQGRNSRKYNTMQAVDPVDGEVVPLYHPRRNQWHDHFAWNWDYSEIVGTTPIGRATVEAIKLNRSGIVGLRRALFALGEQPPKHIA